MFFFYQHRYVHYRIMPVIAYQESKAGNSSHHLKRMGEFLQCYVKETAKFPQSGRMPFPITQKQRLHGILLKSHEASAFISLYLCFFIFLYLSPLFHRFEIPVRISGSVPSILDNLFCKICICIRSLDFFRFLFICIVFGIFSIVLIC